MDHEFSFSEEKYRSDTFVGFDDVNIEEVYLRLFPRVRSVPSTVRISEAKIELIKFLNDKNRFTPIGFTLDYQKNRVHVHDDEMFGIPAGPPQKVTFEDDSLLYFLDSHSDPKNPILIRLTYRTVNKINCQATSRDLEGLKKFYEELKNFVTDESQDGRIFFGVLYSSNGVIDVKKYPLDDTHSAKLNVAANYGASFVTHHENIVTRLNKNSNGIFIFHGNPGTGKTTYIKHLAKILGGRRMFIFIPTSFIDTLISPSLIPVLLDNKDSVLVLEDAEKAIISREQGEGNDSIVSSLLNIGDGILGSMLNLSMIVTFNTSRERIDQALLRKGRLLYEHKFDKLSIEDSQSLLNKLNKNYKVTEPMSLADIYNIEVDTNHREEEKRAIGFGVK